MKRIGILIGPYPWLLDQADLIVTAVGADRCHLIIHDYSGWKSQYIEARRRVRRYGVCGTINQIAFYLLASRLESERDERTWREVFDRFHRKYPRLPIATIQDVNSLEMHAILTNAELDLLVNMGGGLMKAATFNRPKMGTINVHPGLVPYYRGANANFWAVYHNDFKKVGVTVHQVDSGVDSGPVILTATIPVYKDDSLLKITRRAYESGVNMLITALVQFQSSGNLPPAKACDDKFAAYGWYGLTHYLRFLSRLKSLND